MPQPPALPLVMNATTGKGALCAWTATPGVVQDRRAGTMSIRPSARVMVYNVSPYMAAVLYAMKRFTAGSAEDQHITHPADGVPARWRPDMQNALRQPLPPGRGFQHFRRRTSWVLRDVPFHAAGFPATFSPHPPTPSRNGLTTVTVTTHAFGLRCTAYLTALTPACAPLHAAVVTDAALLCFATHCAAPAYLLLHALPHPHARTTTTPRTALSTLHRTYTPYTALPHPHPPHPARPTPPHHRPLHHAAPFCCCPHPHAAPHRTHPRPPTAHTHTPAFPGLPFWFWDSWWGSCIHPFILDGWDLDCYNTVFL